MATVKKPMAKKAMMMKKKSAPKKAAAPMMSSPMMKKGGKVKKAATGYTTTTTDKTTKKPVGMTMKELVKMYPGTDTLPTGDVRGTEMNAYAPKKEVKKFSDIYKAFQRKFGNKPATNKTGGVVKSRMRMGGKMSKKK
jgi:hypothetical protein